MIIFPLSLASLSPVQEDRAIGRNDGFCGNPTDSAKETSIWRLDPSYPDTQDAERIYQVNRAAKLPPGQVDTAADDCGNWETSGIIDVTDLFDNHGCNPLLLANAQSHSVRGENSNDLIVNELNLEEGGQIFFLCKKA
jgi:glycerophosphoryl diester phosphodiesterase